MDDDKSRALPGLFASVSTNLALVVLTYTWNEHANKERVRSTYGWQVRRLYVQIKHIVIWCSRHQPKRIDFTNRIVVSVAVEIQAVDITNMVRLDESSDGW